MRSVNIASSLAVLLLFCLIISLLFVENSEKALYRQTVEELLTQSVFSSEAELLAHAPALRQIRQKMLQAERLAYAIQLKTRRPVPAKTAQERFDLQGQIEALRQLRREIRRGLNQLRRNNDVVLLTPSKKYAL